jgi:hypothetical protein
VRCSGVPLSLDNFQTLTWKYSLELEPTFDGGFSTNQFETELMIDMAATLLPCDTPVRLRRRAQADLGIIALEYDPADVLLDESKFILLSIFSILTYN